MKKTFFTCLHVQEGSSAPDLLKTEVNLHPGIGLSPDQGKTGVAAGAFSSVTPENGFPLSPTSLYPWNTGHRREQPEIGGSSRSRAGVPAESESDAVIRLRDLCRVRLRLLDLFKSFFDEKPEAEKLGRWRGVFAALVRTRISPGFDREVEGLVRRLWQTNLRDLQREAGEMAVCLPKELSPEISRFMTEAGFVRSQGILLPENIPVFPLDILAALVVEEKQGTEHRWAVLQARFLVDILNPLVERLTAALQRADSAGFYCRCSRLLGAYIALEMELATIRGSRIPVRHGKVLGAFADLFAAIAPLTGAALTRKTICRADGAASDIAHRVVRPKAVSIIRSGCNSVVPA